MFDIVKVLKFIYLITKNYLSGKFWKLDFFMKKIENKIQDAFEDQFEIFKMRIGVRIRQEYFIDARGSSKILEIVKNEVDKASEMSIKGKHFKILVDKIFNFYLLRSIKSNITDHI